jgi:catechol 2,3-dioxygenase-like lactoylglutathione lyase family enzyme
MKKNTFPMPGMELTHILVVRDVGASKNFYTEVLGAQIFREYGSTSVVVRFLDGWLLLVTSGGPTRDKPEVEFTPPEDTNKVSASFTIRVQDCHAVYEELNGRGAKFLTPPVDWGGEIRAFFRDPDGHLFEISQAG